ncbi:MAG TPA: N-acetylmuramoyl-L-alanine amidase [Verrucomicrobiae bacterium]|nr:N-acetylmuramoyl-L-alanine amidase [Verrucomicrobiae bacterium]
MVLSDGELATESDNALSLDVLAGPDESAARLAARYGGSSASAAALKAANDGAEPVPGAFYRIPLDLLSEERRRLVLSALFPEEIPTSPLEFGTDAAGPYAIYRLKPGEALYSAVVVRFTGRVDPTEVNTLAALIAGRSGITDPRSIDAGYPIKIPLELVNPEFLPNGAPARADIEEGIVASTRQKVRGGAERLSGVHVILDAGHGGDDSGAVSAGVQEKEYAYDILCRVRALLEKNTKAVVTATIRDQSTGYRPQEGRIRRDRDEEILSEPPFSLRSSGATTTGVNLRWRLANAELDRLSATGVPDDRVVFLSFHADSLHPSIRGTMIYVPGPDHRRSAPRGVTLGGLRRSEGLSRGLARRIIASLRAQRVAVEPYQPIRNHVIRSGREWVPAVLRDSRIPHALLVEVANLNNEEDRALIVTTEFRQRVAAGIVDALVKYYEPARSRGGELASTSPR